MWLSELFVVDLSTLFAVITGNNEVKRNGLLLNVSNAFRALGSGEGQSRIEHNFISPSVITLNPAIRDRVKSGHREWQKT